MKEALYAPVSVNGVEISAGEQFDVLSLFSGIDMGDADAAAAAMDALPESVQSALYTDITVGGTVISGQDQREMMKLLSNLDEDDADAALEAMDALPESIYSLIEPSIDMEKIISIVLSLVILYAAGAILSALQGWIMATASTPAEPHNSGNGPPRSWTPLQSRDTF